MKRILVTGATGNVGREVVKQLGACGCPVRAMSRNPQSAGLPSDVEVVGADPTAPETLDAALQGIDAVLLVWMAGLAPAAAALERIARHAGRNVVGRPLSFEELPPHAARQQLLSMWPPPVADMLLSAYAAAAWQPAFVTSTIAQLTGRPAASFEQWTIDHSEDFKGELAD